MKKVPKIDKNKDSRLFTFNALQIHNNSICPSVNGGGGEDSIFFPLLHISIRVFTLTFLRFFYPANSPILIRSFHTNPFNPDFILPMLQ